MAETAPERIRLSHRKRTFALVYAETGNATQAALRIGATPASAATTGFRLSRDVKVKALVRHLQDTALKATEDDARLALAVLRREALGEGPDTSSHARVRAAERLGAAAGLFADERTDATTNLVNTSVNLTFNNVTVVASDLDLASALAAGRALPQLPAGAPPAESMSRGEGG